MDFFDSLVHPTPDGQWLQTPFDARLDRLIRDMEDGGVDRACLVGIAEVMRNEDVLQMARAHPGRLVPIAGFNPASFDTTDAVKAAVAEIARAGFAGIKLHCRFNRYDPLDARALAAVDAAGACGLPAFVCTLFRQPTRVTLHPADIVDRLAKACPKTRIVLLHGGASSLLDLFELGRMHDHLIIDLSFTLLRYANSSLEADMRFMCRNLDQRVTFGSDFPEYMPSAAKKKILELTEDLPDEKRRAIFHGNLDRLFASWFERAPR
ncbi:amidohydrolase family protein [Marinovum sp.]|uniref:amidohydrolase family protein n=1 Tax=Marinovum sp. TaxID=2024839 RepID=UPI003A9568DF